jgi:hypothetical protein
VDDPDTIPNTTLPIDIGTCLEYAIYHSPLAFIRQLLELGANVTPTHDEHAGFPPLLAALSSSRSVPGSEARSDVAQIIELLLEFGADPAQRGINDPGTPHGGGDQDQEWLSCCWPAVPILVCATIDDCTRRRSRWRSCGLPRHRRCIRIRRERLCQGTPWLSSRSSSLTFIVTVWCSPFATTPDRSPGARTIQQSLEGRCCRRHRTSASNARVSPSFGS